MAGLLAVIAEVGLRHVVRPLVGAVAERELDDPEREPRPQLAVGLRRPEEVAQRRAPGADDELPDAALPVLLPAGVLGREALVVVIVPVDDDVDARAVERGPEGRDGLVVAVEPGAEARVVPDRHRAAGIA